jgi:hypothetical protein
MEQRPRASKVDVAWPEPTTSEERNMADNTARARQEIDGMRKAIRGHVEKWKKYPDKQDKDFAVKTIVRVQTDVTNIKEKHPSLKNDSSWEDTWKP